MLYVLRCKCEHVEWDNKRRCTNCGKKFKNKYILNDEYNVVPFKYIDKREDGELYYNPLKPFHQVHSDDKPLYVLQCKCGCCEFDNKRKCLNCGKKFHNNYFRNNYLVVRYDWLSTYNDGHYFYKIDKRTGKLTLVQNAERELPWEPWYKGVKEREEYYKRKKEKENNEVKIND